MKNPHWAAYYDNAPSKALKEYIRISFDNNPFVTTVQEPNYEEKKKKLSAIFTDEDWQYLIDNTENGLAKIEYRKHLSSK